MKWLGILLLLIVAILLLLLGYCQNSNNWPTEPISMLTPYVTESDINVINEAYSETTASPWGFVHQGIDFFAQAGGLTDFQAVANGVVQRVELWQNTDNNNWQVNIAIKYNNSFTYEYGFEPMSALQADGQTQLDNILVAVGDSVNSGQLIGRLHSPLGGSHVHFSLFQNLLFTCPEPYFTTAAQISIMNILHNTFPSIPDIKMCYL